MRQSDGSDVTLLAFELAQRSYGLPLEQVVEVLYMATLTPVPDAPDWLSGMLNLRGDVVPVIDLRRRLGYPAPEPGLATPIIVGVVDGSRVGLIVDRLAGIVELPQTAVALPPVAGSQGHPVRAVGAMGEHIVLILDLSSLAMGARRSPGSVPPASLNGAHALLKRGDAA